MKRVLINFAEKFGCTNYILKLYFLHRNYLKNSGWLRSIKEISSVDKDGMPIPWFNYAAIKFLNSKHLNQLDVFEYGSGNSTLWFSGRVNSIDSVESDKNWYDKIGPKLTKNSNVKYILESKVDDGSYAKSINTIQKEYDIVIIDGKDRNNCCYESIKKLKPNGIIIWDNSDVAVWQEGIAFLTTQGYKRIDFWGIPPLVHIETCTTVFYKNGNCLDI